MREPSCACLCQWFLAEPTVLSEISRLFTFFMCRPYNLHIGQLVKSKLREQGRSVVWLATQIPCTTNNLHKILKKKSIDVELLWRISEILHYNFFQEIK